MYVLNHEKLYSSQMDFSTAQAKIKVTQTEIIKNLDEMFEEACHSWSDVGLIAMVKDVEAHFRLQGITKNANGHCDSITFEARVIKPSDATSGGTVYNRKVLFWKHNGDYYLTVSTS